MNGVIGIVGRSGSGKTTLICRLLPRLGDRRICVVKRTHHSKPSLSGGKDTDRYLEAGAARTILVTPIGLHVWSEETHETLPLRPIEEVVARAREASDLVIIESAMYEGGWPRLLIFDRAIGAPDPLPPELHGLVTDDPSPPIASTSRFVRDQIDDIARFVIRITA